MNYDEQMMHAIKNARIPDQMGVAVLVRRGAPDQVFRQCANPMGNDLIKRSELDADQLYFVLNIVPATNWTEMRQEIRLYCRHLAVKDLDNVTWASPDVVHITPNQHVEEYMAKISAFFCRKYPGSFQVDDSALDRGYLHLAFPFSPGAVAVEVRTIS